MSKNINYFFLYFIVSALVGLFVRDIPGQPYLLSTISNFMTPDDVTKLGDPGSFAIGARDVFSHGWIKAENAWLIRLWPPGFMFLEGMVLKVFGIDAPFILVLVLINAACFALMLSVFRGFLRGVLPEGVASTLPLVPLLFPVTRFFVLQPGGIILGEGFSIAFFLTFLFLVPVAVRDRSWVSAVFAGLMLALSAYFRSQFELIVTFLTLTAIVSFVAYFLVIRRKASEQSQSNFSSALKFVAVAVVVANVAMAPWRIYSFTDTKNFSWVQTAQLIYKNASMTDKELLDVGGGWIVRGGGNAACRVDPSYCGTSEKEGFYRAFVNNVSDWYAIKLGILDDYWFSDLPAYTSPAESSSSVNDVANFLFLFFVLATFPVLWLARRSPSFYVYLWQSVSFYACFFVVFTFAHYEARYFFAVKIFSVFSFIAIFSLAWKEVLAKRRLSR